MVSSSAQASQCRRLREAITTCAPASARAAEIGLPQSPEPPVTTATRPPRSKSSRICILRSDPLTEYRSCKRCQCNDGDMVLDILELYLRPSGSHARGGDTPLIRSARIGPSLALPRLYFKLENCNPSGSYKDRFAPRKWRACCALERAPAW